MSEATADFARASVKYCCVPSAKSSVENEPISADAVRDLRLLLVASCIKNESREPADAAEPCPEIADGSNFVLITAWLANAGVFICLKAMSFILLVCVIIYD